MAADPSSEHHQQQVKRLKQRGHCCRVYRTDNCRGSSGYRAAPVVRRLSNWTIRARTCAGTNGAITPCLGRVFILTRSELRPQIERQNSGAESRGGDAVEFALVAVLEKPCASPQNDWVDEKTDPIDKPVL